MEAIDERILREATEHFEKVSGARIRTLDVFYYHEQARPGQSNSGRAISYSYGDDVYLRDDGILRKFFKCHGTLARSDSSVAEFREILSNTGTRGSGGKVFAASEAPDYAFTKAANLNDLADHLAHADFGKLFTLYTIHYPVRTLLVHLSIFAVFEQQLSGDRRDSVAKEILWWMLTKAMPLVTETFSTDLARAYEQRALAMQMVEVVRHLVKNIPVKANLMRLHGALQGGEIDEAKRIFYRVEKQQLLRDIVTDIIYSFDTNPEELLLAKRQLTTYSKIFSLLIDGHHCPSSITITGLTEEVAAHPANAIPLGGAIDTLIVILNLWSNATKQDGEVKLSFACEEEALRIRLRNQGEMSATECASLESGGCHELLQGEGLNHLREARMRRASLEISVLCEDGETEIELRIEK